MRGFLLVTLALLTATLAGCSDAPEATTAAGPGSKMATSAPEWTLGQHWSYRTTGGDSGQGAINLVVTGDEGGDWIVDTNDATMAYYDDLMDVSYVGKIRKTDLAGAQGSERVKFFDFPLEKNKTWKTTWDGVSQDIVVKHVMDNGDAHLMAHDGNGMTAEYTYSAQAGFFESIIFYDANGTEMYKMERTAHGLGYNGNVLRYDLHDKVVLQATGGSVHQATTSFGDANEFRLILHGFCNGDAAGNILIGVSPKADDEQVRLPPIPTVMEPEYGLNHDCSQGQVEVDDVGVIRIEPGQAWNFDLLAGSQNGLALVVVEPRVLTTLSSPF